MKIRILTYLFFNLFFILGAQELTEFEKLCKKYPDERAVYLLDKEHLHIKTKKDQYQIWSDFHWQIQLLSDKGNIYSDQSLPYSKFTSIKNIKATSFIPKGTKKFKKVKVKKFITQDVMSSGVFYDDSKQISFNFPAGKKRGKFDLKYTEVYNDPHFLGKFYFTSHLPTKEVEFSVTFPSNVTIHYNLFNTEGIDLKFTKTQKGKNTTYTWRATNQEAYKMYGSAPGFSYYAPHVIVRVGEIKLKTKTDTVLPNISALYNWYYSLVKDVNSEDDEHLKNITDSLVKGVSSRDDKARIIFNWVQDNIKYVAFEDGMGGFVPRQAANVCTKRYGDCKDMASIITTMLRYADVESYLTWVGYRKIPYKYSELPTPHVDNHMIASYKNEQGKFVFLDAVGSYTPYGYPTGFIQGKQTLVGMGKDKFELVTVPIIDKEENAAQDSVFIDLNGGDIKGTGKLNLKGYSKLDFVYPLINKNEQKRIERLNQLLEKGNNKFKIQKADFVGIKDRDKDLNINYDFTIQDYAKSYEEETYINLNFDKDLVGSHIDIKKRKGVAMEFEYKTKSTNVIVMNIPSNKELSFLPKNHSFKSKNFGFEIEYTKNNNQVIMKKTLWIDLIMLEKEDFEQWNKMVEELTSAYRESITLKAKK